MDILQLKHYIIDNLSNLPIYKSEKGGCQHVVKCPMTNCTDRDKDNHGHFSINIDPEDDSIMIYRCFKCDASGVLTSDVLFDLGIELPPDYEEELRRLLKRSFRKGEYNSDKALSYRVPNLISTSKLTDLKLRYLEYRLGIPFDATMCSEYKIILNFGDFIKFNEIKGLKQSFKLIQLLHYNYIGFLSSNNNMIVFRNLYRDQNKRYINFTLHDKFINNNTYYSIPNAFDLFYTDPVHIHIAEGIFDILSVLLNVNNNNKENHFYFAANGIGFQRIIKNAIYSGLNTNLTLDYYADKDKDDFYISKQIDIMKRKGLYEWLDHINIHRNHYEREKDYGVHKDRIIDKYWIIK